MPTWALFAATTTGAVAGQAADHAREYSDDVFVLATYAHVATVRGSNPQAPWRPGQYSRVLMVASRADQGARPWRTRAASRPSMHRFATAFVEAGRSCWGCRAGS